MRVDIKKAFILPFSHPKWRQNYLMLYVLFFWNYKIDITHYDNAGFLSPIYLFIILGLLLNWFAQGYLLQYAQNEIRNRNELFPKWTDFGNYFLNPIKWWFAGTIYMLPIVFISIPAIIGHGIHNKTLVIVGMVPVVIYCLIFWFISPYIMQNFAENFSFKEAMNLDRVFNPISNNLGIYLLNIIISGLMYVVIFYVPFIIFHKAIIIGSIISSIFIPYYNLITTNLFAQAYRESKSLDNKEIQVSEG